MFYYYITKEFDIPWYCSLTTRIRRKVSNRHMKWPNEQLCVGPQKFSTNQKANSRVSNLSRQTWFFITTTNGNPNSFYYYSSFAAKGEVSKRIRVRLTQVSPCRSKDIRDQILTKLQKILLSQEVCNIPCKIYKPYLRCRHLKRGDKLMASVNFDIQMNQNVISTSKFCNNTCARCQMEDRLKKLISGLRMLTVNNKLNVSLNDQTFTVTKGTLRVIKESDQCFADKDRSKRKIKRQGKLSHKPMMSAKKDKNEMGELERVISV